MAQPAPASFFDFQPDPENPGWSVSPPASNGTFLDVFGAIHIRVEGERHARVRIFPEKRHLNIIGSVHGGFIMAVVDHVLFLAPAALGIANAIGGSTINTSVQFFAPLLTDKPMDVVVEILRETGKMIFMRGLIEQDGAAAVAFSGTIKKASQRQ